MMRYRVYVWRTEQDIAATVVQDVLASLIETAIQAVLRQSSITFAYYVWVISPDDDELDYFRYRVSAVRPCQGGAHGKP